MRELGILLFDSKEQAHKALTSRDELVAQLSKGQTPYHYRHLCDINKLATIFQEHDIPCQVLRIDEQVTIS
jgi:hypothetical protein